MAVLRLTFGCACGMELVTSADAAHFAYGVACRVRSRQAVGMQTGGVAPMLMEGVIEPAPTTPVANDAATAAVRARRSNARFGAAAAWAREETGGGVEVWL